MRGKKPPARAFETIRKLTPTGRMLSRLAATASHAMMGAAIGLGFAFVATRSPHFGVTPALLGLPAFRLFDFALTSAVGFAIVATLTGLAMGDAEES
ncbi:hypothetical protein BJ123_113120 [Rhodopseudomonas thermotolerans]|uniref:Uncharacterized protein n=2 Tax=Rhodopseudomonas TaxID=1073 RepID=A0A336JQ31_9BRAD|nr:MULTISPECIES: hypothetical protein [Rhodopseudomonas]RED32026.1 hypothetical protein BJ125_113120 [Rhodopseudomonas pentothenatexigens]REF93407.1 hypothetical protein BJ123_113120 [Rhodopseudomonas thermotolerans]SSW91698.1 hypothetical protein SAMN05892882_113120 [Rhodopseudomonas pentothenatexigens]